MHMYKVIMFGVLLNTSRWNIPPCLPSCLFQLCPPQFSTFQDPPTSFCAETLVSMLERLRPNSSHPPPIDLDSPSTANYGLSIQFPIFLPSASPTPLPKRRFLSQSQLLQYAGWPAIARLEGRRKMSGWPTPEARPLRKRFLRLRRFEDRGGEHAWWGWCDIKAGLQHKEYEGRIATSLTTWGFEISSGSAVLEISSLIIICIWGPVGRRKQTPLKNESALCWGFK